MRQFTSLLVCGLLFFVAGILQFSAMPRIDIWGAHPDLLLVVAYSLSVLVRPGQGALAGFVSGLLIGGMSGATLTHYILSRTVVGYALGMTSQMEPGIRAAAGLVAAGTLVGQLILMFLAPPSGIGVFLKVTILEALLNGAIAIPVFALMRRVVRPKVV